MTILDTTELANGNCDSKWQIREVLIFSRTKIPTKIAKIDNSGNFVLAKEKMLSLGFSSRYYRLSGYITDKTVWSGRTCNFSILTEIIFVNVCQCLKSCRFLHVFGWELGLVSRLWALRPPAAWGLLTTHLFGRWNESFHWCNEKICRNTEESFSSVSVFSLSCASSAFPFCVWFLRVATFQWTSPTS